MSEKNKFYSLPDDCDFMSVGNNDSLEYDCSPKLTDRFFSEFVGIVINTPNNIVWSENASPDEYQDFPNGNNNSPVKFMLSGLAHLPDSVNPNSLDLAYDIVVVAVNQKTAESYSGKMVNMGGLDVDEDIPAGHGNEDQGENELPRKYYFNIDLVKNLNIPIAEATYTVYATLGEYKSNIQTVSIKFIK